jgi:hypothetical protein
MQVTGLIGIFESLSYSLTDSVAWKMTSALQEKQQLSLIDDSGIVVGKLLGLLPILQPIKTKLLTQQAFFLFMRSILEFDDQLQLKRGNNYSLVNRAGGSLGQMTVGFIPQREHKFATPIIPFLLLSAGFVRLPSAYASGLINYVNLMTDALWHSEPINWTTHWHHLTAAGEIKPARAMAQLGIDSGVLVVAENGVSISPGPAPLVVSFKSWRGAGKVSSVRGGEASGSCATTGDGSSSNDGGSSDGGSSGGGSGGDGGGSGGSGGYEGGNSSG